MVRGVLVSDQEYDPPKKGEVKGSLKTAVGTVDNLFGKSLGEKKPGGKVSGYLYRKDEREGFCPLESDCSSSPRT